MKKRAFKLYVPQIRIGNGPWMNAGFGAPLESESQAESIASQLAKGYLGVAESRASRVEEVFDAKQAAKDCAAELKASI